MLLAKSKNPHNNKHKQRKHRTSPKNWSRSNYKVTYHFVLSGLQQQANLVPQDLYHWAWFLDTPCKDVCTIPLPLVLEKQKKKLFMLTFYSKKCEVKSIPSYWPALWQYVCVETWVISMKFHMNFFALIYELQKGFTLLGLHLPFSNLGIGCGVNKKEKGLVSFQGSIVGLLERKNTI